MFNWVWTLELTSFKYCSVWLETSPTFISVKLAVSASKCPKVKESYDACAKLIVFVGSSVTPLNNFQVFAIASLTKPVCWYVPDFVKEATIPRSKLLEVLFPPK